ncbi:hypothetical protein PHLCEN_2v6736 [Hermanssonia centrifuga]|uniref:Uncharacterized protein n=1 Tax=Hermanssonia centrifuga TaxID=98765 RepID=A0A2R6NYJ7_9APHY|nr:hypothetical protein PHLCEN_2v6736 [Hermanssonia centrifuga]
MSDTMSDGAGVTTVVMNVCEGVVDEEDGTDEGAEVDERVEDTLDEDTEEGVELGGGWIGGGGWSAQDANSVAVGTICVTLKVAMIGTCMVVSPPAAQRVSIHGKQIGNCENKQGSNIQHALIYFTRRAGDQQTRAQNAGAPEYDVKSPIENSLPYIHARFQLLYSMYVR